MGAVTSKVRLYDLAKELKIDTKRLIEDVRREGVDVSVPSNSISKELAEKIRDKYFPKKDTAVKRAVRVVKNGVALARFRRIRCFRTAILDVASRRLARSAL